MLRLLSLPFPSCSGMSCSCPPSSLQPFLPVPLAICADSCPRPTDNTFGSILLEKLVGFDKKTVLLLNMPYGALQIVCILLTSWCATRFRVKSLFFALLYVPPVVRL